MKSDLGERVPFEKPVVCGGGVEIWLNSLLETVKDTVKNVVAAQAQLLHDPDYDFVSGFVQFCGQVMKYCWCSDVKLYFRLVCWVYKFFGPEMRKLQFEKRKLIDLS